ncbi:sensor histidine kinase [Nocardia sp. NPDC020380]|uniref:sensor histidine kinase n=1 Tax=Nocardia sp. NPDC020380 TaxID=3364309 RepID=UPI0037970F32
MSDPEWDSKRPERFSDVLVRPVMVAVAIAGTVIEWPMSRIPYPGWALPLFLLTSLAAVATALPWTRLSARRQVALMSVFMGSAALVLPMIHTTTAGALFPFVAAAAAGEKLSSRRAALAIVILGGITATVAAQVIGRLDPTASQWSWWAPLTVILPVWIGFSNRYRQDALRNAQRAVEQERRAAEQDRRAAESEAREAALIERGRIAREIHDVLGHSLSGIALQLDMADALQESGREAEANAAVRRARALAVDSIGETRRAVHALREDSQPLPDTLRHMAATFAADCDITGAERPLPPDATHTLVRVAQEALTNAAKHAPGAPVSLRLVYAAGHTTLTVTNGPATHAGGHADGTGMGLAGMRERVALLGGVLRAGPEPGSGWTVEVEIPA